MAHSRSWKFESLHKKQRCEIGRNTRKQVARNDLGTFNPKERGFDPIEVLLNSTSDRVPQLLPIKYGRMAASPFAFFRGSVSIMAADLGRQPHTSLLVQLCGDAHVQNLGSFEAPDGRIVFDINDFDETIQGPWEWDVKRMAASIVLAGAESEHSDAKNSAAVEDFVRHYIATLIELADEPLLRAARYQIHRIQKARAVSAALMQAERARPMDLLAKYAELGARDTIRFRNLKPVLWRITGKTKHDVLEALPVYRKSLPPERLHLFDFFRPVDVAFKVVGTGSVGLRDYVVLMEGSGKADPLFLQIKQEVASAYYPYLKNEPYPHEGIRVVEGQHKIQPISDLLLGWTRIGTHDYLVRQLNDHKGSIDIENLRGTGLNELAEIAGALLARGHMRSGDPLAMKAYIGNPERVVGAIVKYAMSYAEIARADFEQFQKAIKQHRIQIAS
jgi:uncharacterized protein (DUF2252 family)